MEAMEDLTQEIRLKARYLLLAVPLMERSELSDAELLKRWSALYGEAFLAEVTQQPTDTREVVAQGLADEIYVKLTHDGRIVGLACIKFIIALIAPASPAPTEIIIQTDNHLAHPASKTGTLSVIASQFFSRPRQRLWHAFG